MKKIILLFALFFCSTSFAQKFSIKSDNGNVFFIDKSHTLKIKVEGYDSSKVLATYSALGILSGEDGRYTVNLDFGHLGQNNVGDSVRIDVFVIKEDGNYMIGGETFFIARKNDFGMGIDKYRSGDYLTISEFNTLEKIGIAMDDAWTEKVGNGYKVVRYECIVVPENGNAEGLTGTNENLSNQLREIVDRVGVGCKIIFDDIVLKNATDDTKKGSRIFLNLTEKRGTYLYPFAEKESYTIDELMDIENLTAQVGPDSPLGGTVYQIISYEVLLVPKVGLTGAFMVTNNKFSEGLKKNIKENMKPGDKILMDNIRYIRPDGTYGNCSPVAIFIK